MRRRKLDARCERIFSGRETEVKPHLWLLRVSKLQEFTSAQSLTSKLWEKAETVLLGRFPKVLRD